MRLSWKLIDVFYDPAGILEGFGIMAGWTVIDYGCGPGRYLKKASALVGPEGKVYAVDIHDVAINCSRAIVEKNELHNVKVVKAREYFVPIPEDTADLIYVLDVFHMVKDAGQFLEELHRLVKPGGRLILEDGHQKRSVTTSRVLRSRRWKIIHETKKHVELMPINKVVL